MFEQDVSQIWAVVVDNIMDVGLKLIAALIFWLIGGVLVKGAVRYVAVAMERGKAEGTVAKYVESVLAIILRIVLVVAILGYLGVETTTFAALLAGAGLAIGTAWGGLLSNFAAGFFLVVLRPFKKGDFVSAGGIIGTVEEVGIFVTVIDTMDNVRTIIGNNKIFSETIQNFTTNPFRRVDLVAQLDHGTDYSAAIKMLEGELAKIPNVVSDPAPQVEILEFNLAGPVLATRPFCHNDHYWDVYFATNEAIRRSFGAAGFSAPTQHVHVTQKAA